MEVLIVSAYFPHGNAIGAVHFGKLTWYLTENGFEVRVLCTAENL